MTKKITAQELYTALGNLHLERQIGVISFNLAGVSVKIDTTDTVGITLQAWLKQYLTVKHLALPISLILRMRKVGLFPSLLSVLYKYL